MSNELMALDDVMTLGQALAESDYFTDAKDASKAIVKVLAGQELGIGPIAAMSGINIIKGKAEVSGNVLASLVKLSNKYNYFIREHTNETCVIEFFENGESIGISEFSMEDAKLAKLGGKDTYKAFPRNMLFNRAISNGVRWFCPDVTNGQATYTPGEIETEHVPDLIIENPKSEPEPVLMSDVARTQNDVARLEWIRAIKKHGDYPDNGTPLEKMSFINKQFEAKDLDFMITVKEVVELEN
jgi:hypothetical protein